MRETKLPNCKLISRMRGKLKCRRKLRKEQQLKESSRRTRQKKLSAWHRLKMIDRRMPRRLKHIFSTRSHRRKRESKRLQTEVPVSQKLWIAWLNLCQIRTKKCKQNKTKITLQLAWQKMSSQFCKTLTRKETIVNDTSRSNIFSISRYVRKNSWNKAKLGLIDLTWISGHKLSRKTKRTVKRLRDNVKKNWSIIRNT